MIYFIGFLEIFHRFPGDIWRDSWRYVIGFLEISDRFPGDI